MSRQAYYKHKKEEKPEFIQADMLIQRVKAYRLEHPSLGVRKVYNKLQPFMQEHGIQIGRTQFIN